MTPDHEQLIEEMENYIKEIGGFQFRPSYADHLEGDQKQTLGNMQTVPATYIRTRADRVCFFKDRPLIFEYDAKTNTSGPDFFVECIPVLGHLVAQFYFGLTTIYGFRWPGSELSDIGIALDGRFRNIVDAVFVYRREAVMELTRYAETIYSAWFPNAKLIQSNNANGSGDPSIRIPRNIIKDYPHWREVIYGIYNEAHP